MLMLIACGGRAPGSFDTVEPTSTKLSNLFNFGKGREAEEKPVVPVSCPEIIVLDEDAGHRVSAGGDGSGVRYQYSMGDVARECSVQGDNVFVRVGVEGRVLLGGAGSSGTFAIPIRLTLLREKDNRVELTHVFRTSATIPAGQSQAPFTIVSEPIRLPYKKEGDAENYVLKIGFDRGGAEAAAKGKPRR
jgi:hypothetical protein